MSDAQPAGGPLTRPDGLTVLRRTDPVTAARALARELGGTVAIGGPAVRDAVEHRLRFQHLGIAAPPQPIDLDRLGAAMRRAEAVLAQTRSRVAAGLARSLNTALAIHPDTIRRAATDVVDAERALRRARNGDPPGRATGRLTATALGIVGVGGGSNLAFAGAPARGLGLAGASLVVALVWGLLLRRHHRRLVTGWANQAELARSRWQQVAGPDDEPDELDRVLQRYDPQREAVGGLTSSHPAVRAAERAVADRRRAWVRGWRLAVGDLSDDEPSTIAPRRPLVLGDLYSGLDEVGARHLHERLRRLHGDAGVVVVLRPVTDDELRGTGTGDEGGSNADPTRHLTIDLRDRADALAPGGPGVAVQPA